MLRDRIVCGINDTVIQKRLLEETKLTFKQASELARTLETAARNAKELKTPWELDEEGDVHKLKSKPMGKTGTCFHCGKPGHYASKCRVNKEVICRRCGKPGHLQKACRSEKKDDRTGKLHRRSVCHVEEDPETESELEDEPVFQVRSTRRVPPYEVAAEADGREVTLEVDTGSSVESFRKLWPDRKLSPCKYRLRSYAQEPIAVSGCVSGCVEVKVKYKGQVARLPLIVVEGNGHSLLGRNWLEHIVLDWRDICHISTTPLQVVLGKH